MSSLVSKHAQVFKLMPQFCAWTLILQCHLVVSTNSSPCAKDTFWDKVKRHKDLCNKDLCNKDLFNQDLCNKDLCNKDLCDKELCNNAFFYRDPWNKDLCNRDLCNKCRMIVLCWRLSRSLFENMFQKCNILACTSLSSLGTTDAPKSKDFVSSCSFSSKCEKSY